MPAESDLAGLVRRLQDAGVGVDELVVFVGVHEVVQAALAEGAHQQEESAHAEHGRERERAHLQAGALC